MSDNLRLVRTEPDQNRRRKALNLNSIDLNMLVALDALLSCKSVSLAANQLGLSQPAVSAALSRLRVQFEDELLVRTGNRMILTAKAEAMIEPLKSTMSQVENIFSPETEFDPVNSCHRFKLIGTDYVQKVLLLPLFERLQKLAPNVDLVIKPPTGDIPYDALANGETDIVFAPFPSEKPGVYRHLVLEETFIGVVRAQHPYQGQSFDCESICRWPHTMVSFRGDSRSSIDDELEKLGHRRRVAAVVPYFSMALNIVRASDAIAIMPKRFVEATPVDRSLRTVRLPMAISGFKIFQYWHQRTHQSKGHKWLRQVIQDIAESEIETRSGR